MNQKNDLYIKTFDGWRAIAFLLVIISHMSNVLSFGNLKLRALLNQGAYGVQVFFVISGYLITSKLLSEEKIRSKINLKHFYIKRIFRILPPATLYLLVVWVLHKFKLLELDTDQFLRTVFFIKNFFKDQTQYLSHFWSLSIEEQFYMIWPMLLFFTKNKIRLVTIFALLLFNFIVRIIVPIETSFGIDYFGLIIGSYLAILNFENKINFKRFFHNFYTAFLIVLITLILIGKIPDNGILVSTLTGILLVLTIKFEDGWLHRVLETNILKTIGIYSYSLYIWQQLFVIKHVAPTLGILQTYPINLFMIGIVSYLSFNFIEKPAIKLGRKFLN